MQQATPWREPQGVLGELAQRAAELAAALRPRRAELERLAAAAPPPPPMLAALTGPHVAVIAEIKRASPSRGVIRSDIDAAAQAAAYAAGGAAAISILTEPSRFQGSLKDLETASGAVRIPLLRKDFLVSEDQILEAVVAGASAVLLIARALRPERLVALTRFAFNAGLEPLVEVREERELNAATSAGARFIGVNARNLETLAIQPTVLELLVPQVPRGFLCVAESGITSRDEVMAAASAGADAVLVGSAVSAAADPTAAVRALTGVEREPRGSRD